mmetsp:Transcript_41054/g.47235  ORF Transcript_41054/g.47235 Transcript_41054/m.47235 type:complete len:88 (+) Transcript_41054:2-265(+)
MDAGSSLRFLQRVKDAEDLLNQNIVYRSRRAKARSLDQASLMKIRDLLPVHEHATNAQVERKRCKSFIVRETSENRDYKVCVKDEEG